MFSIRNFFFIPSSLFLLVLRAKKTITETPGPILDLLDDPFHNVLFNPVHVP